MRLILETRTELLTRTRTKEAQEVYEKALFYDRSNPDIYYNVSLLLTGGAALSIHFGRS